MKIAKTDDLFSDKIINTPSKTKDIYTVSRLNFEVSSLLSGSFPTFWITGEISNLSKPPSGHIYFALKDAKSSVQCAMFKAKRKSLIFDPKNGKKVILKATVGLYEARGSYQLNVLTMTEAGIGQLHQQFEMLKNKLQTNGWFDNSLKKSIPKIPQKVGVVTSPDGAVIFDIITVFKRRFPATELIIYPTIVQGDKAASSIAKMIDVANKRNECEVLIVGRGGGSLEDLWAFNELTVAEAIYRSRLPIVCAVGHELDVTIADFVADIRSPTPSAAAELLSENQQDIQEKLTKYQTELLQKIQNTLKHNRQKMIILTKSLKTPELKINQFNLQLDELFFKLSQKQKRKIVTHQKHLHAIIIRLNNQNPVAILSRNQQRLNALQQTLIYLLPDIRRLKATITDLNKRLFLSQENQSSNNHQKIQSLSARLDMASPLKTLSRGYAIAYDKDGQVINDGFSLNKDDKLWVRLQKTAVLTKVEKTVNTE